MQLQRLLGELVVALEEPYRSAILLRYYEGLEPARIGESLGVPAGTVRWRVSEGIARLRAALGKRTGDDRSWRLALLPLISEPATGKGAILVMSTKTKVALTVAAVGVSLAGGGLAWQSGRVAGSARRSGETANRVSEVGARASAEPPGPEAPQVAASSPAAVADSATAPARRKVPPRFVPAAAPPADAPATAPPRLGRLPKEEIRRGVRGAMPAMKACYARLLQESPGTSGRLTLRFTIVEQDGAGRISDASVVPMQPRDGGAPELIAPATEACILQALAAAPFSAPVGGSVLVIYPLLFAPKPPPPGE
jgi:hypothetical protein